MLIVTKILQMSDVLVNSLVEEKTVRMTFMGCLLITVHYANSSKCVSYESYGEVGTSIHR